MITTKNIQKMSEAIKLDDRKTVYATEKLKSRTAGEPISLHPKQAEAFVNSGKATYEATEGGKAKSKKEAANA